MAIKIDEIEDLFEIMKVFLSVQLQEDAKGV